MSRLRVLLVPLLLSAGLACSESPPDATPQPSASAIAAVSYPLTLDAPSGKVTLAARPNRIVSLSATATEMLFAIGARDQVVAVDDQSNYPEDAPKTNLSGYTPNAEAIAKHDPDLVVISDDLNNIVKSLTALKIPVLQQPAAKNVEDTYAQLEQLGRATGQTSGASNTINTMKSRISQLLSGLKRPATPPTYYHELDDKLFSVTSDTFIGQVYKLAGLVNIADGAKGAESGYPQLSAEYIVQADPDIIFLADAGRLGQSAETVSGRPGWDKITAVRNKRIVALNEDVASRWGPRIVQLLTEVVRQVSELEKDAA